MMDFEPNLVDLVQQYRGTFDAAGRKDLMSQYNKIFTENVYDLGVFVGRYGLGMPSGARTSPMARRCSCTPGWKMPSCWISSGPPWTSSCKQNRPDTIPVYK